MVKEITVEDLKRMRDQGEEFQLVDVREAYETEIASLGGHHIPLNQVLQRADEIAEDKMVVVHCRSGARSQTAIRLLQDHKGFDNLYNLQGGIMAWADRIDPSVPKY